MKLSLLVEEGEKLSLIPFNRSRDLKYWEEIGNGAADTHVFTREKPSMYIVTDGQENRLGVVGLFYQEGKPWTEIAIDPKYRGHGLLSKFYELLAKKHGLKRLWISPNISNTASVKSHEKAGFVRVGEEYGKVIAYKDF